MKLAVGLKTAIRVKEILSPFCERCEIAGSVRREKRDVKDVEIVCIPKQEQKDLFGEEFGPMAGFIDAVNKWEKVKGEPTGKYTARNLPNGVRLDLFIATKDNWGFQFAIRTGSAEFSHNVLAVGWVKKGYKSEGGILRNEEDHEVKFLEEQDIFDFLGIKFVEPKYRN